MSSSATLSPAPPSSTGALKCCTARVVTHTVTGASQRIAGCGSGSRLVSPSRSPAAGIAIRHNPNGGFCSSNTDVDIRCNSRGGP